MPKYLVTQGSNFQPFTYDELSRPLYEMAEAQNNAQDQYDALSMQTEALRRYISDNDDDREARALYNNYANRLKSLQENLWVNGYTPSTRKYLSEARAGFSSDINRLGKAIENRQARSAEYWKTKHDHPDMIMGADPGTSGLDNYLKNDLYGTDWYHYSGNQFMSEVGADAKARANEMYRNPEIMKDPRLAGYITRVTRDGFTSDEVANASDAVRSYLRGDATSMANLDPASSILANVLLSHLESTGAAGNVSDDEFSRLVEYGISGLSQAIGKTDIRDLSDKQWDYNKQIALADYNNKLAIEREAAKHKQPVQGTPYSLDKVSSALTSPGYEKVLKELRNKFIKPFESPIRVKMADGSMAEINDPLDANDVLNKLGRADLMGFLGGIDPESITKGEGVLQEGNKSVKIRVKAINNTYDPNVNEMSQKTGLEYPYAVQKLNDKGQWVTDATMTDELLRKYDKYDSNIQSFRKDNPDVDLRKLSISDADKAKLYEKSGIPDDVPLEFAPYVLATKSGVVNDVPVTIAGATPAYEKTREVYYDMIRDAYTKEARQRKIGKQSSFAFYPIKNGIVSDKGVQWEDVFGSKGDKKIDGIDFFIGNLNDDKSMVNISVDGKSYAIDPRLLGVEMNAQIQKLSGVIPEIMRPVLHPESVFSMGNAEIEKWRNLVKSAFGDYLSLDIKLPDGSVYPITPLDVVMTPELQDMFRTVARQFSDSVIAQGRDKVMLNPMQTPGYTSANATGYNIGILGQ